MMKRFLISTVFFAATLFAKKFTTNTGPKPIAPTEPHPPIYQQDGTGSITAIPIMTRFMVTQHDKPGDCWVVVDGNVLDVTNFIRRHPGGPVAIITFCGKDGTEAFNSRPMVHDKGARRLLMGMRVGMIEGFQEPKDYTLEEVHTHNTAESCWILMREKIYDVTSFIAKHPGGVGNIIEHCGLDAQSYFDGQGHSGEARKILSSLIIGQLKIEEESKVVPNDEL